MKIRNLAITGAVFMTLETISIAPATAALLEFSFNTDSDGTGSFTLNTDKTPDPEPARLFAPDGTSTVEGFQYLSAVSDFSFFSPDAGVLNFIDADVAVFPTVPFAPESSGVLSFVGAPARLDPDEFSIVQLALEYSGNVSALPVLSDAPSSYSSLGSILVFESNQLTADIVAADLIIDVQISRVQSVPELNSVLSLLTIGLGGAGLLTKRNCQD